MTTIIPEDFAKLAPVQQSVLYKALLSHVKSRTGDGFYNHDRFHPSYFPERNLADTTDTGLDGPKRNTLYRAMHAMAPTVAEAGEIASDELVTDWPTFCRLAQKFAR